VKRLVSFVGIKKLKKDVWSVLSELKVKKDGWSGKICRSTAAYIRPLQGHYTAFLRPLDSLYTAKKTYTPSKLTNIV
jgi:hypothetical protein